jgi:hypothetical protein
MGVSIFFILFVSFCGAASLFGYIWSQTRGDKEFEFKHFIGLTVFSAVIALLVGVSTMQTDYSKLPITLSDKKITISSSLSDPKAGIYILRKVGSESPGYDFMVSDGKGGLFPVSYPFDKITVEGNDFYIREVTKRSPSGFFNFRNTMTHYFLILPERVLDTKK